MSAFERREYRENNDNFDLEHAKKDYETFLQTVPKQNRMLLELSFEEVKYIQKKLEHSAFGYSVQDDAINYDPSKPVFWRYDFSVILTHELSHRIDHHFVHSWKEKAFSDAIQSAQEIFNENPSMFVQYIWDNDVSEF